MIVCHCMQLTDRALREIACEIQSDGPVGLEQVMSACGAGACCGGCKPLVAEVLREAGAAAAHDGQREPRRQRGHSEQRLHLVLLPSGAQVS